MRHTRRGRHATSRAHQRRRIEKRKTWRFRRCRCRLRNVDKHLSRKRTENFLWFFGFVRSLRFAFEKLHHLLHELSGDMVFSTVPSFEIPRRGRAIAALFEETHCPSTTHIETDEGHGQECLC